MIATKAGANRMNEDLTRRTFLTVSTAAMAASGAEIDKPAVLGGKPVRLKTAKYPAWPVFGQIDEQGLVSVLRSGGWYHGKQVAQFEQSFAKLTGGKYCIATANGTSALLASLTALGIGPGDEVLIPPFTFVATVNVVFLRHALPVFVDTDVDTCQMDTSKIETAITGHTTTIIPVHYGGNPANLDAVLDIAKRRNLHVVEDACQAHIAGWRGKNVGNWGETGCFSFQATKNLNSGEGGAVITNSEALADRCYAFHNQGRKRKGGDADASWGFGCNNTRMTEFQAALLLSQMTRLEEQSRIRERNAEYLNSLLREIPGVRPQRSYDGCTRHNHHTYVFRYEKQQFAGMAKSKLLEALQAEGIPARGGYTPLNTSALVTSVLDSRIYRSLYSSQRLAEWRERNVCPGNEDLCRTAVVMSHETFLGPKSDMDEIAAAVRKVQTHAAEIAKA